MTEESRNEPSPLEGLIRPWFFPSFGATVVFAIALFWWTGLIGDSAIGAMIAIVVPLVLAGMVLRPALDARVDPVARALLGLAALLAFAVPAIPAYEAVHPGEPALVAELAKSGDAQSVPAGVDGQVLL
ncbi:MAG TPA: hypothetical protein VFM45_04195, partial [Anaeromyxobacteraceae bacterium]|nr:hypothetical protein [Anaeromyxobacteraceae bacterium]